MGLEITDAIPQETNISTQEKQWLSNLDVAYRRIQLVVSTAFVYTIPDIKLPKPAPIVIAPDDDFNKLILTGIENTGEEDPVVAAKKKAEITNGGQASATAAYVNEFGTIILSESTAKGFQTGGIEGRNSSVCFSRRIFTSCYDDYIS